MRSVQDLGYGPTGSWRYPRGLSSSRSQRIGLTPAVILAHRRMKGKGQNGKLSVWQSSALYRDVPGFAGGAEHSCC
jgi:hypothetical protein